MEKLLDFYTDYLIASFGQTSATGLSELVDNSIKHDSITRLLAGSDFNAKTLWKTVKSLICLNHRLHQVGKVKIHQQNESFCDENKDLQSSIESSFQRTCGLKTKGLCVT